MSNEKLLINDSKSNNSEVMRNKQIEVLKEDICLAADYCYGACDECNLGSLAKSLYDAGYRKQEWISVEERLPETKLETITVEDVKIGSGGQSIPCGTKEQFSSQVSEPVAIFSNHPQGAYIDIDRMIDGVWSNNWYVTHWMPLPEPPKKGGGE